MLEPAVAQVMAASSSTAKFPDGLDEETLDQTDLDKKLALALAESLKRKKRKLPSPVKHEEQRSTIQRKALCRRKTKKCRTTGTGMPAGL